MYTTKQVASVPLLVIRTVYGKVCFIFVSYIPWLPFKQFQYLANFVENFRSKYFSAARHAIYLSVAMYLIISVLLGILNIWLLPGMLNIWLLPGMLISWVLRGILAFWVLLGILIVSDMSSLVPKFVGSNPVEAVGFLGRKNPQHAFLRRGSKAVGPMSLNLRGSRNLVQNYRTNFSSTVPPFATRISRVVADVQAPGCESVNV